MAKFSVVLTGAARSAGNPAEIEAAARAEIGDLLGPRFVFRTTPTMFLEMRIYFAIGGTWFVALPLLARDIWMVDLRDMGKLLTEPRATWERVTFSNRLAALVNGAALDYAAIEAAARTALASGDPDAHGTPFVVPLEMLRLCAWREGCTVEIDLDELQVA